VGRFWRPEVNLLERRDLLNSSQVVLISLDGQSDGDILIGGRTAHDRRTGALLQIFAEWNSDDSYDERVAKISAGNGVPRPQQHNSL
jgi:hypothetical protein